MPTRRSITTTEDQFDASDATHARELVDNTELIAGDAVVKALVVLKGTVDDLINNDSAQDDSLTSIISGVATNTAKTGFVTTMPTATAEHTVSLSVTNNRGSYALVITMVDSSGRSAVTKTATIALS
jgi:hypothetical protein